jgi:hypothetical protein
MKTSGFLRLFFISVGRGSFVQNEFPVKLLTNDVLLILASMLDLVKLFDFLMAMLIGVNISFLT